MVLSDRDIKSRIREKASFLEPTPLVVNPLDESRIQPASIDLTLDDEFKGLQINRQAYEPEPTLFTIDMGIDLACVKETASHLPLWKQDSFTIQPDQFILGSTAEYVEIPDDLCARVEGKSSLGRLGLLIHLTAGYIDPGFRGKITLEIVNLGERPIILRAGLPICQLSLIKLSSPAECPYGHESRNSKYQDQKTVTGSRYAA